MNTVIFKTEDAKFQFNRKSVLKCLGLRKSSYDNQELDLLMDVIRSQPETATLSIEEHQYFGHVAIDLIDANEGSVVCKNCGKKYRSNQLEAFTVEPDEATFKAATAKKGGFKSLFRKKLKPIGLSGGKGVKCPEGHMLIFMITWRT